ncbi:thiazole synthase [Taylorella asinigenitalis]|uniref:thiazole synthase n=1 Tax=Taylorella asinigenitalis TaxID=84590 RepID=UPI00048D5174|nr:thiazole synthase [Taylorella asinigenitalis]
MGEYTIGGKTLKSRFFLGTAQYPSPKILLDSLAASEAEVITVSLKRQMGDGTSMKNEQSLYFDGLKQSGAALLPNTAGCKTAHDAINVALMAREVFETNWIKLEVIGDDYTLQPDMFELVKAAEKLIQEGFEVFPYCTDDLVTCQRLLDAGCKVLMPWGAPIGSGQGLINTFALRILRARLPDAFLVIDAGIGSPKDAAHAMELGFDAVLLNSAVSQSHDPVRMAKAFKLAIEAGRLGYEAGVMSQQDMAIPSTQVSGRPFSL